MPLDGELSEPVKQHLELAATNLNKIGLKKVNDDHWICRADVENAAVEAEDETVGNAADVNMGDAAAPSAWFSNFDQLVIGKLDNLTMEQRNHHEFCIARFQHMDLQIEAVQEQLAVMAAWNEPKE